MSSWSMDDGSSLSGTFTFTNGSAVVQGNSSADTTEIKVGDIVIWKNSAYQPRGIITKIEVEKSRLMPNRETLYIATVFWFKHGMPRALNVNRLAKAEVRGE